MAQENRIYIAIDLKSFYASVECIERGLDPLMTNLVVADPGRTEKTICLAVSKPMKDLGIPGRPRLFEVIEKINHINEERKRRTAYHMFTGSSHQIADIKASDAIEISYITAPPRMALYMEYSTRIYNIYLKYVAPEDIHVYSIDEVFIDISEYRKIYDMSPRQLAVKMIKDVWQTTGITATAGIGTNLYLAKVAMDIVAKHIEADKNGVRIAELNEKTYREMLWSHKPITDFWRVGPGYARKLYENGLYTMGDIARCSIGKPSDFYNEELLYKLFGVNAELLIDHAWGWEPCTIKDIKAYKPGDNSMGAGQVLPCSYTVEKAKLVLLEMIDQLVLNLVEKGLMTNQITVTIGYDIENLNNVSIRASYRGEVTHDRYGRKIPKHAHGSTNLGKWSSSTKEILDAVSLLYDRIINKNLLIRRIYVTANHVVKEEVVKQQVSHEYEQLDLFTDYEKVQKEKKEKQQCLEKEKKMQQAMIDIKNRFGKNAVLKGMNLQDGATARERNRQIGGHKA